MLMVELMGRARPLRTPIGSESEFDLDAQEQAAAQEPKRPPSSSAVDLGARGTPTHNRPTPAESAVNLGELPAGSTSDASLARSEPLSGDSAVASGIHNGAHDADASGVRIDSGAEEGRLADPEISGVRLEVPSGFDAVNGGDSASRIVKGMPAPAPETSGVRIDALGGADGANSASRIYVKPDVVTNPAEESSAVDLGTLGKKKLTPASDLNLASDVLESGTSGVANGEAPAAGPESGAQAVVHLNEDSGALSVRLGEFATPSDSQETSGLDLTMLSGSISGESSSIWPERPVRPGRADKKTGPRSTRPPSHADSSSGEHFRPEDDSAVDLGAAPQPTTEEQAAEQPSPEPAAPIAIPAITPYAPSAIPVPTAPSRLLIGAGIGAFSGMAVLFALILIAPGIFASLGVEIRKPGEQVLKETGAPRPIAGDPSLQELLSHLGKSSIAEAAQAVQQLEQDRKTAETKAAELTEQVAAANEKSAKLAQQLQDAVRQGDDSEAKKKITELTAELQRARKTAENARQLAAAADQAVKELTEKNKASEEERQAAEQRFRGVATRLEAAGINADHPERGLTELVEARQNSQAALQSVAKKLRAARYLPAQAEPAEVARALDRALADARAAQATGNSNVPPVISVEETAESNPLQAEDKFAQGVQFFWAGEPARAEEQFLAALRSYGRDARYHYYLGLTRWSLNRREQARQDFLRGAALERQDRPGREAINAILERIQGDLRQEVDQYRK
jgi:hypothetical protein